MLTITDTLKQRVADERAARQESGGAPGVLLRLMVDSGGCAGFQYKFSWETGTPTPDDTVYGEVLVIDDVSLPFLADATIDFVKTLMGADFKVINPHATSGCGCGNSFAV